MHVLVADDDRGALAFLAEHIAAWRHRVTTVRDGTAAVEALQRDPTITVAILNWMMPGRDGWQIARDLKKGKAPGVHVLVAVGQGFCREVARNHPRWADGYVSKPFDLNDVRARLRACCRTKPEE